MKKFHIVLACCLFAAILGCGGAEPGVIVQGTVTKDGAPIKFEDSEGVTITLSDGKSTFTSNVGEDGKFSVQKPAGGPIPYGQYKVSYTHYQNKSPYSKAAPFKREKSLPESWDVSGSKSSFSINVEK